MINKSAKQCVKNGDKQKKEPLEMTNDLATVACYAAAEIDNLLLGRPNDFGGIRRLVELLEESFTTIAAPSSPQSLVDPAAAVAMNYALYSANPTTGLQRSIDDVVLESQQVIETMTKLVDCPPETLQPGQREDLEKLRTLCLSFSNKLLLFEDPIDQTAPEMDGSLVG